MSRRRSFFRWAFLLAAALTTVCASLGVGLFMGHVANLPPIEELEVYDPPEVTHVHDRFGSVEIGKFQNENRQVVPLREMPVKLREAFIAIEDRRFSSHFGVDVIGVFRALVANIKAGRTVQGASTITQQLTRNILPVRVGNTRSYRRKIREAILSIQIERRYSKDQILEFYLNHIDFSHNAFGVKAAAATYFSRELRDLTTAECAVLAGIPKATTFYNPKSNPKNSLVRRNEVLKAMHRNGYLTDAQHEQASEEPLGANYTRREINRYPYFHDALKRDLNRYYGLNDERLQTTGLTIHSTLNPAMQEACIRALENNLVKVERRIHDKARRLERHYREVKDWKGSLEIGDRFLMQIEKVGGDSIMVRFRDYTGYVPLPDPLPYYEPAAVIHKNSWIDIRVTSVKESNHTFNGVCLDERPVQGSVVVLDARSGEVLALVGGTNFYDRHLGWYNRAILGGRQVGSCMKPFFYASAMKRGFNPSDMIIDEFIQYDRHYRPVNYGKKFSGPTTLIEALEDSMNVVTLRLFEATGPKRALADVRKFDFMPGKFGNPWDLRREINICLGTFDCSPLDMALAYQVFANQGVGVRPQFFKSIVDSGGRLEIPLKHRETVILDPVTAYQMVYLLRQVVVHGTGYSEIGRKFKPPEYPPVCGKTGTTNLCKDAWFCGFTPDLVIVAQVGYDTPNPMGRKMTGGKVAGPIWADVFREIINSKERWTMEFPVPERIEEADICSRTGKLESDICGYSNHKIYRKVPFRVGGSPAGFCDGEPVLPIIRPVGEEWDDIASLVARKGVAKRPDAGVEVPLESILGLDETDIEPVSVPLNDLYL
jgi:penicillin-binding protein 1A